jgi:hypothetical protein
MRCRRLGRAVLVAVTSTWLLVSGVAACDDSGPGVPASGEQGDDNGFGNGGDRGSTEDGRGDPGEGAAGDEVGGGG